MAKQFANRDDLNTYVGKIEEQIYGDDWWAYMLRYDNKDDVTGRVIASLVADGYDLDNLTADGHRYNIGGHTNHGWMYSDEVDWAWINTYGWEGEAPEIRDR